VAQPRVALATCAEVAELDGDDRPLLGLLAERGVEAAPAVWDDAAPDWSRWDLVVVRSTWDYPARRAAFLAWAESLPRVLNASGVLRWNTDKRYLRDLAAAGLPVVPTTWVEPGDDVPAALDGGELVVKPAVSAGSRDTARYRAGDREGVLAHVRALRDAGRTVLVQPYLDAVDTQGETAQLFLDGRWSHAIRKGPILRAGAGLVEGLYAEEQIAPRAASPPERALAEAVLDALPFPRAELLYARVDTVAGADGRPLLLEVELTEPSLFLAHADGAAARLADAIAARLT
jgi:glutathione synthase/RimK-type ligase-like ATP-grasp enzyme